MIDALKGLIYVAKKNTEINIKRTDYINELEKLSSGKTTFSSFFKSSSGIESDSKCYRKRSRKLIVTSKITIN